jgi:hypothetical protein
MNRRSILFSLTLVAALVVAGATLTLMLGTFSFA